MKKIFTLILAAFAALTVKAQSDFALQFADAEGNIIADGTTLILKEAETTPFGDQIPTNLYAKNQSASSVNGGGIYTINTIDNGSFSTCFPKNCVQKENSGSYETDHESFASNSLTFMNTEWIPDATGRCEVDYQLVIYTQNKLNKKWKIDTYGPTIKLKFTYDPEGTLAVNSVTSVHKVLRSVEYYSLDGQRVAVPAKGIYIVRQCFADGTSRASKQTFR